MQSAECRINGGRSPHPIIMTTGSAGGLFCPYKGLFLAATEVALKRFANRIFVFSLTLKRFFYLLFCTVSPVNGSMYSLSDN